MSVHVEKARELRSHFKPDGGPVYNCAQAVVAAFAEDAGLAPETCRAVCAHFGGGMKMGSVCGAVTGGLMVLGLLGLDDDESRRLFYRKFKEKHDGMLNCSELLRVSAEKGEEKIAHCNGLIFECVENIEAILSEKDSR